MKAIGYTRSLPISDGDALQSFDLPTPEPGPRDLLVDVQAISVNPVDVKLRMRIDPDGTPKILGYDASGVVLAAGSDVTLFRPGDTVFYAGAIDRPGTNSQYHLVDERIVGGKPEALSHLDAAALPLTAITAWELLFDRLTVPETGGAGDTLLIVGGAGGVGSILIQLARQLTELTVVATASRPETQEWTAEMGAHHTLDHRTDIPKQLKGLGLAPRYIAGLTATESHFPSLMEAIQPQGRFALVDDPDPKMIDITLMKQKAVSLHWEFMFTRPLFQTTDMIAQHTLLNRVADLVDRGDIKTTARHNAGPITVDNLREAHRLQESGKAIGKTVLGGW